jgi:hypothetical protein
VKTAVRYGDPWHDGIPTDRLARAGAVDLAAQQHWHKFHDPRWARAAAVAAVLGYGMATLWSFISSTQSTIGTSATPNVPVTPNLGDLMLFSVGCVRATTAATLAGATDGGANNWNTISPGFQTRSTLTSQSWWRVATAADTGGITVTGTLTGGSGTITSVVQCDIFRLPAGNVVVGIDVRGGSTPAATTTTSWHPSNGSSSASFTDALAYTMAMSPSANRGVFTGTNTFTGTSSAANLTPCNSTNVGFCGSQYAGLVQANATAASNTFVNTWTNSVGPNVIGATFTYTQAVTFGTPVVTNVASSATTTAAFTGLPSNQPILFYLVNRAAAQAPSSVADNFGTPYTWTLVTGAVVSSGAWHGIYIGTGGGGGSGTVTATWPSTNTHGGTAVAVTGGASTASGLSAIDTAVTNTASATSITLSSTPSAAGDGAFYCADGSLTTTLVQPSSPWSSYTYSGSFGVVGSVATQSNPASGSSLSATWSNGSSESWQAVGVTVFASGSSPSVAVGTVTATFGGSLGATTIVPAAGGIATSFVGSTTDTVTVIASGSVATSFTASANGTTVVPASGNVAAAFTAGGPGVVQVAGAGSVAVSYSGSGTGVVDVPASGSSAVSFTAGGPATIVVSASGVIAAAFSGTASGIVVVAASGAITAALSASNAGTVDVPASGSIVALFAAAGSPSLNGAASGTVSAVYASTASGAVDVPGAGRVAAAFAAPGSPAVVVAVSGALVATFRATGTAAVPEPPAPTQTIFISQPRVSVFLSRHRTDSFESQPRTPTFEAVD